METQGKPVLNMEITTQYRLTRKIDLEEGTSVPPAPNNSPDDCGARVNLPPLDVVSLKKALRPIATKATKMSKTKSVFDDPRLLSKESAVIYQDKDAHSKLQVRSVSVSYNRAISNKIQTLVERNQHKRDGDLAILQDLSAKRAKHAAKVFHDNGVRGLNDPDFVSEAMDASQRRARGDFKALVDAKFKEWLVDDSDHEEYYDASKMDVSKG